LWFPCHDQKSRTERGVRFDANSLFFSASKRELEVVNAARTFADGKSPKKENTTKTNHAQEKPKRAIRQNPKAEKAEEEPLGQRRSEQRPVRLLRQTESPDLHEEGPKEKAREEKNQKNRFQKEDKHAKEEPKALPCRKESLEDSQAERGSQEA
jgi:hypothetical protein